MLKYKIPQIVTLTQNNCRAIRNCSFSNRTVNENEVFKIFRRFTEAYRGGKEKATTDFARLSPSVGMRRLERPTPTSRT